MGAISVAVEIMTFGKDNPRVTLRGNRGRNPIIIDATTVNENEKGVAV
jgi:hypothetical protein